MPYEDPILRELGGYFKAEEAGRRERADAWATAIGLQKVDGLTPSQFLFDTAKDHIEGRITQNQARRRIHDYYARLKRRRAMETSVSVDEDKQKIRELTEGKGRQKKVVRKSGKKTTQKSGKKTTQKTTRKSGLNAIGELTEKLTEKLTETEQKIVVAIMKDGHITQGKLAKKIGIARTYVTKVMGGLQARGVIRRVGPDKGGLWEVI